MRKLVQNYSFLVVIAGSIVLVDQITKQIVRTNLALREVWSPWHWLTHYARIIHWKNTGAAFGIFQNGNLVITILAFIVSGLIIYYFPKVSRDEWYLRLAMSLQLGGAVGNLIDRLTLGYVIDYISVGNFPVFNIADASISIGVAVLLLGVWLNERKQAQEPEKNPESSDTTATPGPLAEELHDE